MQQEWVERLSKFIQTYPQADDTPDAMLQAAMVSEFLDKDIEAKNWCKQVVKNFPVPRKPPNAMASSGGWSLKDSRSSWPVQC